MKLQNTLPFLAILLITLVYLLGTSTVPFHPDEATQIYMSADLETLFERPAELFYASDPVDAGRQSYRLLDAPLTRWLIGAGRKLSGLGALPVDWDWTQTWQYNQANGALPGDKLLLVSRLSVAWLFAFTLFFAYRSGVLLRGTWLGWVNMALTAANALVLLHTRRAMAESALLFAVSGLIFALAKKESSPILLALPAGLALNAKQTSAGLVIVALLAAWLFSKDSTWLKKLRNAGLCAVFILLLTYMLNPVSWKNPVATAKAAIDARNTLSSQQLAAFTSVSPEMVMQNPAQRAAGWLVYLFFSPPATADVANYVSDTQTAEEAYFSNPLNNLLRGVTGGVILTVLSLFGFTLAVLDLLRNHLRDRPLGLLLLSTLAVFLSLVLFIPLPFQRYVILLLPFTNLWIAFFIARLVAKGNKNREA